MKLKIFVIAALFLFIPMRVFAQTSSEELFDKANKSYLQGDYEKTIEHCQGLLRRFRTSRFKDDANLLAGLAHLKLNQFPEARDYFNAIIQKKPQSKLAEDAYLGLADTYFLEKNYAEAERIYSHILTLYPNTELVSIIESRRKGSGNTETFSNKEYEALKKNPLYTVQIGSFTDKNNAQKMYRKLKKKGYNTYLVKSKYGSGYLYKVRIGKFESKQEASNFVKKLKRQGYETRVSAW